MATTKDRKQTKAGRFYEIEDVGLYPSVTTILQVIGKPALIQWAAKVEREMAIEAAANLYLDCAGTPAMSRPGYIASLTDRIGKTKANQKELQKAGEIGSQAHALIEWNLKAKMLMEPGPSPSVTDKAQWAFMAWQDWSKSVDLKPIFVEQVVYSKTYGFAGTLDLFAEVNGVPTVIDWKTGKKVYAEAHLQNASYRHALREMGHGDPVAGMIVRLPKIETDPEFEVVMAMPEDECFRVFLHTMELWKWSNDRNEEERTEYEKLKAGATPTKQDMKDAAEGKKQETKLNEYELSRVNERLARSGWKALDFVQWLKDNCGVNAPSELKLSDFGKVMKGISEKS